MPVVGTVRRRRSCFHTGIFHIAYTAAIRGVVCLKLIFKIVSSRINYLIHWKVITYRPIHPSIHPCTHRWAVEASNNIVSLLVPFYSVHCQMDCGRKCAPTPVNDVIDPPSGSQAVLLFCLRPPCPAASLFLPIYHRPFYMTLCPNNCNFLLAILLTTELCLCSLRIILTLDTLSRLQLISVFACSISFQR